MTKVHENVSAGIYVDMYLDLDLVQDLHLNWEREQR